jgi:hypothetical protein
VDDNGKPVDPAEVDKEQLLESWEEAFNDIIYVPQMKKFVRSSRSNKSQVSFFPFLSLFPPFHFFTPFFSIALTPHPGRARTASKVREPAEPDETRGRESRENRKEIGSLQRRIHVAL